MTPSKSSLPDRLLAGIAVPASLESLTAVEEFFETALRRLVAGDARWRWLLLLATGEMTRLGLARPKAAGCANLLLLNLFGDPNDPGSYQLEGHFPFPPLTVNGTTPPYPDEVTGAACEVARLPGCRLRAQVQDRRTAALMIEETLEDGSDSLAPGFGWAGLESKAELPLLALCRCWSQVHVSTSPLLAARVTLRSPVLPEDV